MEKILEKLKNKENLTFEESKSAFEILMTGKADEDQIYNFLDVYVLNRSLLVVCSRSIGQQA